MLRQSAIDALGKLIFISDLLINPNQVKVLRTFCRHCSIKHTSYLRFRCIDAGLYQLVYPQQGVAQVRSQEVESDGQG